MPVRRPGSGSSSGPSSPVSLAYDINFSRLNKVPTDPIPLIKAHKQPATSAFLGRSIQVRVFSIAHLALE